MENWYITATIIPGIGLLILSTSNLLVNLSSEIKSLINENTTKAILIERKLGQYELLNNAMVFLYIAVACFVISALVAGIYKSTATTFDSGIYITIVEIISALISLTQIVHWNFVMRVENAIKYSEAKYFEAVSGFNRFSNA